MVEVPSDQEIQDSGSDPDDNFQSTSMEQITSDLPQSDSPSVISLFDRLRSPTPVDLARMRQLKQNPPPKGAKRGKGKRKVILRTSQRMNMSKHTQMKSSL